MELDAVAWASLSFSLLVLLYKFISLSQQGIRLLDTVAAWFKAVYISYLMVISPRLQPSTLQPLTLQPLTPRYTPYEVLWSLR